MSDVGYCYVRPGAVIKERKIDSGGWTLEETERYSNPIGEFYNRCLLMKSPDMKTMENSGPNPTEVRCNYYIFKGTTDDMIVLIDENDVMHTSHIFTYQRGDMFTHGKSGEIYMLAHVGNGNVTFIGLRGGNTWSLPIHVKNVMKISHLELVCLFENDKLNLIKNTFIKSQKHLIT